MPDPGTVASPSERTSVRSDMPLVPISVMSLDDELARRRLQRSMFDIDLPPVHMGRFELERQVGAGGMGTVWLAHDRQLERTVALKFMRHGSTTDQGQQRMVEEARALAKLNHPHVVAVYDVGRTAGRVWIAMEWVPGQTLRALAEAQTPARELLRCWLDAGRGLAAMHAAGLIHRDIKPDNVLLGDDGRVRLIDFGLVRASTTTPTEPREPGNGSGQTQNDRGPGAFAGTRAYAAPEQLAGEVLDPRADQYAFAVALVEALTQKRPRDPSDLGGLSETDRRIQRALARALAATPEQRFPDMATLIRALEPPRHRRALLASLATGLVAATLAIVASPSSVPAPGPCETIDAAIEAAIETHWNLARRDALREQVGPGVGTALDDAIDLWTGQWRASAMQSCQDSLVDQIRSPLAHDRRMACLDRRLTGLGGLLEAASLGELQAHGALARGLAQLADPRDCLLDYVSEAEIEPIPEPLVESVAASRRALLRARVRTGSLQTQIEIGAQIEARAALDARPLLAAEAALTQATLERRQGNAKAAKAAAGRALDLARDHAALELEAEAWTVLLGVARDLEFDFEAAKWSLARRRAAVERLGDAPRQRARLHAEQGLHALMRDKLGPGIEALETAQLEFAALGALGFWERARTLHDLGNALARAGRRESAREYLKLARALELDLEIPEPGSEQRPPPQAKNLYSRGLNELDRGAFDTAQRSFEQALDAFITEQGPRGRGVGECRLALAALADARGDLDQMREQLELALQLSVTGYGRMQLEHADLLSAVGTLAYREHRHDEAVTAFEQVLRIRQAQEPDATINLALTRSNLAEALQAAGRTHEAKTQLELVIPTLERAFGPTHPDLAYPLKASAAVELALANAQAAFDTGQRALNAFESSGANDLEQAECAWLVAQAARALGREETAQRFAQQALTLYQQLRSENASSVTTVNLTTEMTQTIGEWIATPITPSGP